MATDPNLVQGEITTDPESAYRERDVEKIVAGFLKALLAEQEIERGQAERSQR